MTFSKDLAKAVYGLIKQRPNQVDNILLELESKLAGLGLADTREIIFHHLIVLMKMDQDLELVNIVSSHELSKSSTEKIASYIGADKKVATRVSVDEDLIGGFVVAYNNVLYDNSLKSKLAKFKSALIN